MSPDEIQAIRERVENTVGRPARSTAFHDRIILLAEVEGLTGRLHAEESSHGDTIDQRDDAQEWADKLAYSIAPVEVIGEHSSGNNPWQNALDAPNPLQARLDKVRALHAQGSLHPMDRGEICTGCGCRWPCPTIQAIDGSDQ